MEVYLVQKYLPGNCEVEVTELDHWINLEANFSCISLLVGFLEVVKLIFISGLLIMSPVAPLAVQTYGLASSC